MNNELNKKIESYLFWKAEPVSFKELATVFKVEIENIKTEIENLKNIFSDRGLALKIDEEKVALVTSPETSQVIEDITKDELNKELSKATLETLAIIIYRGPIKKSEIDYIRGVSSQFSIRNLLVRGLIDKEADAKDARSFVYKPSMELLNYLGLSQISELNDYQAVNDEIEKFMHQESENPDTNPNEVN